MSQASHARQTGRAHGWMFATGLLAMIISGCAGDGCTCAGPIPGGFPPEERAANALQLRISDSGLAVLAEDPNALVRNLLGDQGLVFDIPPACEPGDNPKICCDASGNPMASCGPVDIDIQLMPGDLPRLELAPQTGQNLLAMTLRARVRTLVDVPIIYDTGLFDVDCNVAIDTENTGADDLRVSIPLEFSQDAAAGTTRVDVGTVDVAQFDNGDLTLSGGFDCTIADLLVFAFKNRLVTTVENAVRDALTDLTCKTCPSGDVAECGPFASACVDQVCMTTAGECLEELGVASRIPAAVALGDISPGTFGAIDLYDVLGGYSNTDNGGLSLGALGGALPGGDISRRCGPSAPAPAPVNIQLSPFFQGNARPDTGQPFDVAIGVHEHQIDELAWSAYESGFLCINIGTDTVDLLSTDTMSLVMPSILDLVHGRDARMVLGIRPQEPPAITLGRGTFTTDENGNQVIDEPLLDIALDGLEVDFYAMIDDQFIRAMTLAADVRLALNMDVSPDGGLVPVTGDLDNAFQNLRVTSSEALIESPEQLAQRFPAVLDLALPVIVGSLGEIALPQVAGLELRVSPDGVTAVQDRSILAVFADLAYAEPQALAPRPHAEARIVSLEVPDAAAFARMERGRAPVVELALGGDSDAGRLEWSIRVDQGTWSPYSGNQRPRISRPSLWLQGRHHIEVRARAIGKPETTTAPVDLQVLIDVTPPHLVTVTRPAGSSRAASLDGVWIMATDNVSRGHALRARYRVDRGPWQALALPGVIPGEVSGEVEVEVHDEAGNQASSISYLQFPANGRLALTGDRAGARARGCEIRPDTRDGGLGALWLVLVACACVLVCTRHGRGRKLARAGALALAAWLGASGCGDKSCDISAGQVEPGPTGRYSDIAALGDRVVVSAYEESLGDLVLLDIDPTAADGESAVIDRYAIDGTPADQEPVFATCSYRGGVTAKGPDVGAWTSVVLARAGNKQRARVAYQHIDDRALAFALERGKQDWQVHQVDAAPGAVAGLYASLALDPDGLPAIAYTVAGIPRPDGSRITELRFARARVAEPTAPEDWTIQVVDQATISCAGLCADGEQCVADMAGAEICARPTSDCPEDCGAAVCVEGACLLEIPDPPAYDLPQGTGLFNNLAFLPDGQAAIAYYHRATTDLMLRVGTGGTWTAHPLDAAADTDTGMWVSMQVDRDGMVHVAYQDALADQLLYTTWQNGQRGQIEVVDSGIRAGDRPHPVGASAALTVDDTGRISVAYQDALSHDLLIATREDSSWTRNDLATGQDLYGFYVRAVPVDGSIVISSYAYDRTTSPLGQLMISRTP